MSCRACTVDKWLTVLMFTILAFWIGTFVEATRHTRRMADQLQLELEDRRDPDHATSWRLAQKSAAQPVRP